MDGLQQIGLPVLGIVAAAAVTFYVVSFSEIREKSFQDLEDSEDDNGVFKPSPSSREKRARRKARRESKT
ncbi:Transmembrane protein [Trema orientale]|uniref:Transmembrane protein n=1 Tax=Trema orientale TaxID=63057 RepID=A0A2P5DWD7_TREOI|nr:Transmembrane protein [Trema orientale]